MEEDEEEGEDEFEEEGESELSDSSSASIPMDHNIDDDEDEDKLRNKELLRKLEADQDGSDDDEIDAALDKVMEAKTKEAEVTQTKKATDFERAEAIQT